MKTSRLNRVAWIFIALIVTAGVAVSSNIFDGKGRNNTLQATCINSISGLSEYQKDRIIAMETQNQSAMNDLWEKQHAASGKTEKDEIKKQMDKQVLNHGNAIKTLLSADQQKQYILLQLNGDNQNHQAKKQGNGKGKGNGSGQGRGKGMGHQSRF
ncbi:MAG: hypothetical protein Q8N05_10345 [Bacteroidota bacterium]|nr:hypothetical protein [Bacteroidota bacterium]